LPKSRQKNRFAAHLRLAHRRSGALQRQEIATDDVEMLVKTASPPVGKSWLNQLSRFVLPGLVFLLALTPRLAGLGSKPFWFDEVLTAERSIRPVLDLIQNSFTWHHTPVYFLLVAPFAHSADPQFWLRLPSAFLGALSTMLVYLIAARAGGRFAGIAAGLILGLSPTEIAFSQEERTYMLVIFCILVALHGLTGLASNVERSALPWRKGGKGGDWLQFIAGTTFALALLGDSLPWLLAADITAALLILHTHNRPGLLRNFAAANGIAIVSSLAMYLPIFFFQVNGVVKILDFIPPPTPLMLWYDIGSVYLMRISDSVSAHFMAVPTPHWVAWLIGIGLLVACAAGIWRLRLRPMLAAALLPAFLTLPLLFGFISIWNPLLTPRYLLWSGPPFAILAGIGIAVVLDQWPPFRRHVALAAIALLLLVNLLPYYPAETKPRWDIVAHIMAAQAQPGDDFYFFENGGGWTTNYYLPSKLQAVMLTGWPGDLQDAEAAHAQGRRVWAIYGDAWLVKRWQPLSAFQATLAPFGRPSATLHAGSRITIWRYDPTPAGK
jgi:mannosyltransferase